MYTVKFDKTMSDNDRLVLLCRIVAAVAMIAVVFLY